MESIDESGLDSLGEIGGLDFAARLSFMARAVAASGHSDPRVRAAAFAVLSGATGPRAWECYWRGLRDVSETVRTASLGAILDASTRIGGGEPDDRAVLALLAPDPVIRRRAVDGIVARSGGGRLVVASLGDEALRSSASAAVLANPGVDAVGPLLAALAAGQIAEDQVRRAVLNVLTRNSVKSLVDALEDDPVRRRLVGHGLPAQAVTLADVSALDFGTDSVDQLLALLREPWAADPSGAKRFGPSGRERPSDAIGRIGISALRSAAMGYALPGPLLAAAATAFPDLLLDPSISIEQRRAALSALGGIAVSERLSAALLGSDLVRNHLGRLEPSLAIAVLCRTADPWPAAELVISVGVLIAAVRTDPDLVARLLVPSRSPQGRAAQLRIAAAAWKEAVLPPSMIVRLLPIDPEGAARWVAEAPPIQFRSLFVELMTMPVSDQHPDGGWVPTLERVAPVLAPVLADGLERLAGSPRARLNSIAGALLVAAFTTTLPNQAESIGRTAVRRLSSHCAAALLPMLNSAGAIALEDLAFVEDVAGGAAGATEPEPLTLSAEEDVVLSTIDDGGFVSRFRRMAGRTVTGLADVLGRRRPIEEIRVEVVATLLLSPDSWWVVFGALRGWVRWQPDFEASVTALLAPAIENASGQSLPLALWLAETPVGQKRLAVLVDGCHDFENLLAAPVELLPRGFLAVAALVDRYVGELTMPRALRRLNPVQPAVAVICSGTRAEPASFAGMRHHLSLASAHLVVDVKLAAARLLGTIDRSGWWADQLRAGLGTIASVVDQVPAVVVRALPSLADRNTPDPVAAPDEPGQLYLPGFNPFLATPSAGADLPMARTASLAEFGSRVAERLRLATNDRGYAETAALMAEAPAQVAAEIIAASLVGGAGPDGSAAAGLGGDWAMAAIAAMEIRGPGETDLLLRVIREATDDEAITAAAARLRGGRGADPLQARLHRILDWAVEFGRRKTDRPLSVRFTAPAELGYTFHGGDTIWVNPLALLAGDSEGDRILIGLCAHEIGHHLPWYDGAGEAAGILEEAKTKGLHQVLNFVWDVALERRLRRADVHVGVCINALNAYAFNREPWEVPVRRLLDVLGARFFGTLFPCQPRPGRKAGTVVVRSGHLLTELARSGSSFARFMRAAGLGLGNRSGDPKVGKALALLGPSLRNARLPDLLRISEQMAEIFGSEIELLSLRIPVWGSMAAAGIADPVAVRRPTRTINLTADAVFNRIGTVLTVDRPRQPGAPSTPVARRLRRRLERIGRSRRLDGGRLAGHTVDRASLRFRIPVGDPRIAAAWVPEDEGRLSMAVLIDCSSSMEGQAFAMAVGFAETLAAGSRDLPGIAVQFWGFTHDRIFDAGTAARCAVAGLWANGGNNDAGALWHAATNLAPAPLSMVVMVSDGSPTECSVTALRHLVTRIEESGVVCAHVALRRCEDTERCFSHTLPIYDRSPEEAQLSFGRFIEQLVEQQHAGIL